MATRRTPATAGRTGVAARAGNTGQTTPAAQGVAWSLAVLAIVLSAFHVLFPIGGEFDRSMSLPLAAFGVAFAGVGAYVAARRPTHPVGWLLLAIGIAEALSSFSTSYAWRALIAEPGTLPGGKVMAWASTWLFTPVVGLLVLLLLVFPTGALPSRRWRLVIWILMPALAAEIMSAALMPGPIDGLGTVRNPIGIERADGVLTIFNGVAKGAGVLLTVIAVVSLAVRFRRARGDERQGLKWILYVGSLLVLSALANMGMDLAGVPLNAWVGYSLLVTFIALPLTMGAVILRYRLYDIDVIINRTIVYVALSAFVIAVYATLIGGLGAVLDVDDRPQLPIALMVGVTIGLLPVRDRLQRAVNRMMYGDRDDPYAVLERLGNQLETSVSPENRFAPIASTLRQALRIPWVEVTTEEGQVLAASGERTTAPFHLPLAYEGISLGDLVVGHRIGETVFSASDIRLLNGLARQLGAALQALRLAGETSRLSVDLQHSRERLVVAREEERRRLRRDLHDGLGPQLASVTMKAEAAREMLAGDPDRAAGLLDSIAVEAREAVADVRRLVDGLRPPAVDELGLAGAIRAQASRLQGKGLVLHVHAGDDISALPAAVEVVAFRIAVEAMTNIRRHAGASRGAVLIERDPAALVMTVEDDGRGLPVGVKPGVGLQSMRERAEELGGSVTISARPGSGTVLTVRLPIAERGEERG